MPYVIAAACIDITDKSCMEECPVDCIYEGDRKMYINPALCIDCGAGEALCRFGAISKARRVPAGQQDFVADTARFFPALREGRDEPIGTALGGTAVGRVGVDTDLIVI